ncbi:hypothetical protein EVAR_58804_1 [Eumeta japonica]|uniref:Uncharacterized protein n=1 Tax=Eumeta variegata TaxID=151549 RepID=A0A4C1YJS3_EUMVA|nr:hypothetical protein EVAR_58804_1 [Eumeta japonica]
MDIVINKHVDMKPWTSKVFHGSHSKVGTAVTAARAAAECSAGHAYETIVERKTQKETHIQRLIVPAKIAGLIPTAGVTDPFNEETVRS